MSSESVQDDGTVTHGGIAANDLAALLWRGDDSDDLSQRWFQLREVRDRTVPAGRTAGSMAGVRVRLVRQRHAREDAGVGGGIVFAADGGVRVGAD